MRKMVFGGLVAAVVAGAGLTGGVCAAGKRGLEDAPIITSATYQHTQYNGRNQPVEVKATVNKLRERKPKGTADCADFYR